MEIKVKRITYKDKSGRININEVFKSSNLCSCIPIKRISYIHKGIERNNSFRINELKPALVFPRMEVDVDYDCEDNPYETYYEEYDYEEIRFCPICGKEIEIIVEENEDVSNKILPIIDEIEKLTSENLKRFSSKRNQEIFKLTQEYLKIMEINFSDTILVPYNDL